jgi:N-acetylneuraminic acid mutarotase
MRLKLIIVILCFSSDLIAQSWQQTANFSGANRDDAVVFTIDNKAYCGTGQTPWFDPAKDFYSYDMITHQWSQIADMPTSQGRQYASGFDNDTLGFVFGGENGSTFFNDLYAYDPVTDNWTVMSSLPSDGRSGSACFTIENKAYIIGGRTEDLMLTNQVWEYNMTTDIWTQKNNFAFGNKWRMSATSNDTLGYTIFGFYDNWGYSNELYQYDNTSDSWSIISNFPDEARNYASIKFLNNQLIILFGMDSTNQFYNDVHLYDLSTDQWQTGPSLPDLPRRGGQVFTKGLDLLYTTGLLNSPERTNETWILQNPTSGLISLENNEFSVYPCPTSNILNIKSTSNEGQPMNMVVNSTTGEHIATFKTSESQAQLDVSKFSSGTYTITIIDQKGNKIGQSRFIKR